MKRLMKVLEFSTRWYDLPVFFLLILLYSSYLVYRPLTSFRSCLFYLCGVSYFFPPSTPLIHHIPCLMFEVKQFLEIISFRRVRFCQRREKFFIKFYYNWTAWLYLVAFFFTYVPCMGTADGGTVVKELRYKSEGRWFDSRWCHWNFSLT
jgi:hypothetical protein